MSDAPREPSGPAPEPEDAEVTPSSEIGVPNIAQRQRIRVSKRALVAIALLVVTLVVGTAWAFERLMASFRKDGGDPKTAGERPAAASIEARRLDMLLPASSASSASTPMYRIPALIPTAEERAEAIGLRQPAAASSAAKASPMLPEDAPALLFSSKASRPSTVDSDSATPGSLEQTKRQLQDYQRRLQGVLEGLTSGASTPATSQSLPISNPSAGRDASATGTAGNLFGGALPSSRTSAVSADVLPHRSLTLPKGTTFTCALKTKVVSANSGFVGCQVQRNVYGDDGRVLLIERGSHLDGEYRITSIKPGVVRIPVLWVRLRTPNGVTVDLDSPGTGSLGESGIDGYVDNRWPERIGAALLLSLIDDAVRIVVQRDSNDSGGGTVVLPSTTGSTSKLAEKILDSTINIPPLIYRNQGGIVGIYVARDVDFSSVYALAPVER